MEALTLYFNELCLQVEDGSHVHQHQWFEGVAALAEAIGDAISLRSDIRFAFPSGSWSADCGGQLLHLRLRHHLNKERYGLLLRRIVRLSDSDVTLERQVYFLDRPAIGLTLADLAATAWNHGWTLSVGTLGSAWNEHRLASQRFLLTVDGELGDPVSCEVGNLARVAHVAHWRSELFDWGAVVSPSLQLDEIGGHPIVMYPGPREHGPPHVHLLESRTMHRTLAKFRVDVFERPSGPPTWDAQMRSWVAKHQLQLLRSWDRCQRGERPFALEH